MLSKLKHIILSFSSFRNTPEIIRRYYFAHILFGKSYKSEDYISSNDFEQFKGGFFTDLRSIELSKLDNDFLIDKWKNKRFDLLNSGWNSFKYNSKAPGFIGQKYIPHCDLNINASEELNSLQKIHDKTIRNITQKSPELLHFDFDNLIDWHRDHKSGYRWESQAKSQSLSGFSELPSGVDIKMPWEISRMNHLPLMSIYASKDSTITEEVLNSIRSFILFNPYGFGINWTNAMEVGIRAVNMLVSMDILKNSGITISDPFMELFNQSIYNHAQYILENSEYKNGYCNNHYLANVASLLIIGCYYSDSPGAQVLMRLGSSELLKQSRRQFLKDGGNFESSTHYHRLSMDMLIWSFFFLNKTDGQNFTEINHKAWNSSDNKDFLNKDVILACLAKRIRKAGNFVQAISKNNLRITAIGDQDNGRFIQFSRSGSFLRFEELKSKDLQLKLSDYDYDKDEVLFKEDYLNHWDSLTLLGMNPLEGKLSDSDFIIEKTLSESIKSFLPEIELQAYNGRLDPKIKSGLSHEKISKIEFPQGLDFENIIWYAFEDFGLYIARCENFFLAIAATNNHLERFWGHGKNDKLSFELRIGDKDIIRDPGSFNYTADFGLRNNFRSTKSHSTIFAGREQNRWPNTKNSVFNMYNESYCNLDFLVGNTIGLSCSYGDVLHSRLFIIEKDHLRIEDFCNKKFETNFNREELISEAYGHMNKK